MPIPPSWIVLDYSVIVASSGIKTKLDCLDLKVAVGHKLVLGQTVGEQGH